MRDTIFALSSGALPAGVAVIRISGPAVRFGLETLIGFVPAPRMARLCAISDASGETLDRGLVLLFPAPNSFTGEDVAELQIHGSRASVAAVLSALSDLDGFRPAEAGEFTRQAFANAKMDLTEVEGLSDLIRAETEAQRRQAVEQSGGGLRSMYQDWARRLTHARAMIEAELDFSDEEDIPGSISDRIWEDMEALLNNIEQHLSQASAGEIVRQGFRVALVGPPNAGKSSLLNVLAGRDVAIVSDTPGTTRDVVEVRLDIQGNLVIIQDTAGLRKGSTDPIETEGMRRSLIAAENADLVLDLAESSSAPGVSNVPVRLDAIRVWTKIDSVLAVSAGRDREGSTIGVSSKTGEGIDGLIGILAERVKDRAPDPGSSLPTRNRHVLLLRKCVAEVRDAVSDDTAPIEVRSESLRRAAVCLGRITGQVDVEDLLGVIFSEFCVGK